MKRTLHMLALCGGLGLLGGLPAAASGAATIQNQGQAQGMAAALVVHSVTGQALADMPVVVQAANATQDSGSRVFMTNDSGIAVIGPLEDGLYVAYVSFNNNRGPAVYFEIIGANDDITTFTLFFNPDIDPG